MFLPQNEFVGNPDNHLFDEGIAYCRKQQFEKAYQCFKKHLARNSFCQETFQMLSYCHYKFSENLRSNVSDLSVITKQQKSRPHSSQKGTAIKNYHDSSSTVRQNSRSSKSKNDQEKSSFLSSTIKCPDGLRLSKKQPSNLSNSQVLNEKQRACQVKSEPSPITSSNNEPHEVRKSVSIKSCEENDPSTQYFIKQLVNRQLKIELFLRNIESTLSNVELKLNNLLIEEEKVNSDVLSLLRYVSHGNPFLGTKTYRKQLLIFENICRKNTATLCQPVYFRTELTNWLSPCGGRVESKRAVVDGTAANYYNMINELKEVVSDKNTSQLAGNSCCLRQERKTEKESVAVEFATQSAHKSLPFCHESSKVAKSEPKRRSAGDASPFRQNVSIKRKLEFSESYFCSSPQKKLQMSTLLNKAMAKRKLIGAGEADDSKRQKIQSYGKALLLNCGNTFKMLKELQLMSDLFVCDVDPGFGVVFLNKPARRPQLAGRENCLNKVNLGFQSTRNAAIQTELSISCSVEYITKLCSDIHRSSSNVSLPHSNSIITTMFPLKKCHAPVSANSACTSNRLNIFINQVLCEIKDSLSFIPIDFVPLSSNHNSTSLSIREVKHALMPLSEEQLANNNILRFFLHGHYIEFPDMRVYQVDPFWSRHSTCDNSLASCHDLCESRSQNRSPFVYPVCVLLHSLSTDLYNLTILAGPFRIRFVNFNSYFNATASSNHRDS